MRWIIASMIVLLGAGCITSYFGEPLGETDWPGPAVYTVTIEQDDYNITFPGGWKEVDYFSDFSGYGGSEGSFDVSGMSTVYTLPDGRDDVPMFVIMKIDLTDKANMLNYPSERYLGENATSVFYGGEVDQTGPWAFLYAGDSMAKYAEDIEEIFNSVEVK